LTPTDAIQVQPLSVRVPRCQKLQMSWRLNPVWHRMLYSCTRPYGNSGRQRVKN